MSVKTDNEMVDLLRGITEKLDKILIALRNFDRDAATPPPGDTGSQMSIPPRE
jgi:hypothetical protein